MKYGHTKKLDTSFEEAVEKTREELTKEGFGVLTEIDVQDAFRKKLGVEFDKYLILGACNPSLAYKALQAEQEIGLLLPCNVIVYEKEGETHVSAMKPKVAMSMVENQALEEIAEEADKKLQNAIEGLM